jgi:hypothetical protein
MHAVTVTVASVLLSAEEKTPKDEDVVAGWMGFAVFVFLIIAVALIGWALTKSLRTADRAKDAGVYGDAPVSEDEKND